MPEKTTQTECAEEKQEWSPPRPNHPHTTNERLELLIHKMDSQFEKMMVGFQAIERSFKLCCGRMMSFSEDLSEALGKIESDPFEL